MTASLRGCTCSTRTTLWISTAIRLPDVKRPPLLSRSPNVLLFRKSLVRASLSLFHETRGRVALLLLPFEACILATPIQSFFLFSTFSISLRNLLPRSSSYHESLPDSSS